MTYTSCAPGVSIKEARIALTALGNFMEQTSNSDEQEFSTLCTLDNAINIEQSSYLQQKKINYIWH